MDFLNQAAGQLRELAQSMTPAARVTALLLLGVIGVSLSYLVQQHSASPDDYLFNGEMVSAYDIDRAEAAIAQAGLTGFERVGNHVRVPSGRKSEFLAAVADGGALPRNFHAIMEEALDTSVFASGDTRRQKFRAGREQQLSKIISDMDGIELANVIYDIQEASGLSRRRQATATVSVRPDSSEPLAPQRIKLIKRAVASAIAGLSASDVTVADLSDPSRYGGSSEITIETFDDPYFRNRLAYEQWMEAKVDDLLRHIPGVTVQVTAELEEVIERTSRTTTPEGEPAAIREVGENTDITTSEVENGGRPGLTAQGPNRVSAEEANVTVKHEDKSFQNQTEYVNGTKDIFERSAALVPQDVRVSVAIPNDYLIESWREQQRNEGNDPGDSLPDKTSVADLKEIVKLSIQTVVAPLLPKGQAEYEFKKVSVEFFDTLPVDPIEGPSTTDQALSWAGKNFNTMTMAVVAIVSLMMLRSIVKSVPSPDPLPSIGTATLALDTANDHDPTDATATDQDESSEGQRPRLKFKKGTNLKDDLTEIVREDPDAAAAILRSWIGNAG